LNRVEVLDKMEPVLNTQVKEIEHNPRTQISVTPEVVTFRPGGGQRTLEMTEGGVQSLANFVGLPWPIAAKLHPSTFGNVATDLLENKQRYSLVVKDNVVTNVVKRGHYHTVNADHALKAIETGVPGIEFHRILILDNLVVNLEVVGEKREPVARGDLIQAGASIMFSPMGTINPVVQAYALRLSCTNGATNNTVLREFHWGDGQGGGGGGEGDNIWQWFRRSTHEAYGALYRIVQRYQEMLNEAIPQGERASMLEAMLRQAKISGEAAIAIRAMAIENPPENHYDMVNLITYASSHLLEKPHQVVKAREVVNSYMAEDSHQRVCPVCRTRRN